jgi:hypothetical protein
MNTDHPHDGRSISDADYMHFLIEAGELLSSSLDYRHTLKNVCSAAVESVADLCILDVGSTRDVETVGIAHRNKPGLELVEKCLRESAGKPLHSASMVIESGTTLFAPFIDDAWIDEYAMGESYAALMRKAHFRSMIIVPVRSQIWGVTGALTLVRTGEQVDPYDEEAVLFAQDLGRRCGIAIGKARLHSQTLDIAERFQKASLPQRIPSVPGVQFDVLYEPADAALLVGGDWYDVFRLRDSRIGISIGDVSGHGIDAAAQMSSIRNAIRMGMVMDSDLSKVLVDADFLFRNEVAEGTYCTALIAVLDMAERKLTYASAGHPLPVVTENGTIRSQSLRAAPPLAFGNLSNQVPRTSTIELAPAMTMVFYTDGLIEAHRDAIAGEAALREALLAVAPGDPVTAAGLRDACIGGAHADDIAILVVSIERLIRGR